MATRGLQGPGRPRALAQGGGPEHRVRTWFHRTPDGFDEFARRYRDKLAGNPAVDELRRLERTHPTITLLYSVRDAEHNHAAILADHLR